MNGMEDLEIPVGGCEVSVWLPRKKQHFGIFCSSAKGKGI
jgi:hypothetical protein